MKSTPVVPRSAILLALNLAPAALTSTTITAAAALSISLSTSSGGRGGGCVGKRKSTVISMSTADTPITATNRRPRILCLHGKSQSGLGFSRKIGGARRKLERVYDLDFIDGPILLDNDASRGGGGAGSIEDEWGSASGEGEATAPTAAEARAWFLREVGDDGAVRRHVLIPEAFEYVVETISGDDPSSQSQRQQQQRQQPRRHYDAILGFSQGGTLATALAVSGAVPGVRAVVTAGAPFVAEAFDVAADWAAGSASSDSASKGGRDVSNEEALLQKGLEIPKLHISGETDVMIPVESTRELCERGGNGRLYLHEKGHLFPTRATHVNEMLQFLEEALAR